MVKADGQIECVLRETGQISPISEVELELEKWGQGKNKPNIGSEEADQAEHIQRRRNLLK